MVAATSAFVLNAVTGTLPEHQSPEPSSARPRCSSILHLFGPWLFEAAFIGSEFAKQFASSDSGPGRCCMNSNKVMIKSDDVMLERISMIFEK